MNLVNNLEITTMTIGSNIEGLVFNEKNLSEEIIKKCNRTVKTTRYNNKILSISSNFIESIYSEEKQTLINNKTIENEKSNKEKRRGRKKKDPLQYSVSGRKQQGSGKHFNSQLSFEIKSFNYNKNNKIYSIKLFRKGEIGVPGVKSIKDITRVLNLFLKVIKFIFNKPDLELGPIKRKMVNYKTLFVLKPTQILDLYKFKHVLNTNHLDLLSYNSNIQEKHNNLRIKFKYINEKGVKKDFLIEVYLSGKVNIKGKYPKNLMIQRLTLLEEYLLDPNQQIIKSIYTDREEILKIMEECSIDKIEHI